MPETPRVRYRVQFAKTEPMRFIGHLDLYRAWVRTIRRAGVPVTYSPGFTPRPKINIGLALPLGCTSDCELIDITLETNWDPDELSMALKSAAPPGLQINSVAPLRRAEPKLQRRIIAAEYRVSFETEADLSEIRERVEALLKAKTLPRERRGKAYDLRPLVEELDVLEGNGDHRPSLRMRLTAQEGATGRPEEVLRALDLDIRGPVTHRSRLILTEEEAASNHDGD